MSRLESEFLIGLAFRVTLRDVIYKSQQITNQDILECDLESSRRGPCYHEIARYSYEDYMNEFVLPYYLTQADNTLTEEEIIESVSIRSLEDELRQLDNVRVFQNANDFLLRDDDMEWFEDTFGDDFSGFEQGGHLGNLPDPAYQDLIMESIIDLKND